MVKYGNTGEEVSKVQKLLSLLGYDLIVDGSFGDRTLRSVKAFQKKYGLTQDGIVGDRTLMALNAAQKRTSKEDASSISVVDYGDLETIKDCQMPDNQYIKQITNKTQVFIHFTAGGPSAKNTIGYWESDAVQVATAFVIDGDTGDVYEAYNPDYWGFHLGIKGTNGKLDKASIGIEICAFGPLVKKGGEYFAWPNDFTTKVDEENVCSLDEPFRGYSYFFKYTDKQLENLEKLLVFLIKKYNIQVQPSFDNSWLEYNQEVINKCLPGIWTHTTVRKDKSDTYPDERLLAILNKLSQES